MRTLLSVAIVMLSCGRSAAPGRAPATNPVGSPPGIQSSSTGDRSPPSGGERPQSAAAASSLAAQLVTVGASPEPTRLSAMFDSGEGFPVTIDDAGQARRTSSFLDKDPQWIPFSEAVDRVVMAGRFAMVNVAGGRGSELFCSRTRTAAVECVLDFVATAKEPRETRRFRLPVTGAVQQLGVYTPWGASGKVVCATTVGAAACWTFAPDGRSALPYALAPAFAAEVAAGLTPGTLPAWQVATPSMSAARVRKTVRSERSDSANVTGPPSAAGPPKDIAVQCALLDDGALTCFGPGAYGELGDGTLSVAVRARQPFKDAKVVDVAMSGRFGCAVLADGRAACWGNLPDGLPVPNRHKTTPLPACVLDRTGSEAAFAAARTADQESARQCAASCNNHRPGELDTCLGCVTQCVPLRYLFKHDRVCQEPSSLESTLAQRSAACADSNSQPRWLTNRELNNQVGAVDLSLAPVFLTGVSDAVAVALPPYPYLCILRKSGKISCRDGDRWVSNPR